MYLGLIDFKNLASIIFIAVPGINLLIFLYYLQQSTVNDFYQI